MDGCKRQVSTHYREQKEKHFDNPRVFKNKTKWCLIKEMSRQSP